MDGSELSARIGPQQSPGIPGAQDAQAFARLPTLRWSNPNRYGPPTLRSQGNLAQMGLFSIDQCRGTYRFDRMIPHRAGRRLEPA
jgi:hypothetical protein